jgi:SpoVK/Ycf46/Vps4 family AAA+-type ATPase
MPKAGTTIGMDERTSKSAAGTHHPESNERTLIFKNLASRTEGFSGADISSVCARAVRRAVQAGIKSPADQARVTLEARDLEDRFVPPLSMGATP